MKFTPRTRRTLTGLVRGAGLSIAGLVAVGSLNACALPRDADTPESENIQVTQVAPTDGTLFSTDRDGVIISPSAKDGESPAHLVTFYFEQNGDLTVGTAVVRAGDQPQTGSMAACFISYELKNGEILVKDGEPVRAAPPGKIHVGENGTANEKFPGAHLDSATTETQACGRYDWKKQLNVNIGNTVDDGKIGNPNYDGGAPNRSVRLERAEGQDGVAVYQIVALAGPNASQPGVAQYKPFNFPEAEARIGASGSMKDLAGINQEVANYLVKEGLGEKPVNRRPIQAPKKLVDAIHQAPIFQQPRGRVRSGT